MRESKKRSFVFVTAFMLLAALFTGCSDVETIAKGHIADTENAVRSAVSEAYGNENETRITVCSTEDAETSDSDIADRNGNAVPAYSGQTYVEVNGNVPYFSADDLTTDAFELYSELDELGRCGAAYANICEELMPTEKRGDIGMVKPSGWHTVKYPEVIEDLYLYNRCHLIGYQLAGENANEKNLITGTRYLNVTGMLPFENEVADWVKETNGHVLYRVTPVFVGNELTCRGVEMEALSVEDRGKSICFNVFIYNEQPGITIDHGTGESWLSESSVEVTETENISETTEVSADAKDYVLNIRSMKFHLPTCDSVNKISDENRKELTVFREDLIADGYSPCGACNP